MTSSSIPSVLVVDDNQDAADSLAIALRLYGCQVEAAYGGLEGLAAASRMGPDVVILDLNMPGMDGLGAAKFLRLLPRRPHLIALTADSSESNRERTRSMGFVAHLTKPIDPDVLAQQIHEIVRRPRESDTNA